MKYLLIYLLLLVSVASLSAQAPQMLNYQGVARSTNGSPLSNQAIKLRLSIQPANGNPFYVETHDVSTNQFGLYAVRIGQGAVVSGNFANIAWSQTAPFLQVEIDPAGGNNFTLVGSPTPLVSVPYALEAQHATTATMSGDVTGNSTNSTVTKIQNRPVGNAAPATGDVLKWNGTQWQPGTDATSGGGAFSAGSGISISGNVISNEGDLDNYNELQSMYLIGNTLTLSDGGGSVTLPTGVNYNEGTGIEINGNTISNSGDLDNFNELQSISLSGNVLTLSDGGGSVTLPSGGGGGGTNYWQSFGGNDITNTNTGTVFLGGPSVPYQTIFASASNNSTTGVFQQSGSGDALYAESTDGAALTAHSTNGAAMNVTADNDVAAWFFGYTPPNSGSGAVNIINTNYSEVALSLEGGLHINGGSNAYNFSGTITHDLLLGFGFCGGLNPYSDAGGFVGRPNLRWSGIYAVNGTINTSDARQKQAIQPIGYGLQQVMAMKPVSFEWKSNPEYGRKLGFLAQDLQTIVPEVVADKEWFSDENGKQTAKPAEVLGVYYSDLIPVMAKAIQEQQAMIEALNIKNEMLQQKVDQYQTLEKELAALKTAVQALQNNANNK